MSDKPKPTKRRMELEVPKDLQAVYANAAMIANTPAEVVIDFVQILPRMTKGQVMSRVIMSPMHAKLFHQALTQNIANYEKQFGQIRIPQQTNIADQFFKFPPKKEGEEEDDDGDE